MPVKVSGRKKCKNVEKMAILLIKPAKMPVCTEVLELF
jgi:hypothetical protein